MRPNHSLERTLGRRGRVALAVGCVLADVGMAAVPGRSTRPLARITAFAKGIWS
jgi:hypothetical protein